MNGSKIKAQIEQSARFRVQDSDTDDGSPELLGVFSVADYETINPDLIELFQDMKPGETRDYGNDQSIGLIFERIA